MTTKYTQATFDKLLKKYTFFADKKGEGGEYILNNMKYEIKNNLEGKERTKAINWLVNTFGHNQIPAYWLTCDENKPL
jgi:hypothetical protein